MVTVTDSAWKRIAEVLSKNTDPGQKTGLRIKVVGGGCSGLNYKIEPDVEKAGDRKVEKDGHMILVDPKTLLHVKGMTLDYKEELMQSGFVFTNPNAKNTCGCGNSFNT